MFYEHPAFPKLTNSEQKIWRYLDFTKLLDLLEKKSLFFTQPGRFSDPFEGSIPLKNVQSRLDQLKASPINEQTSQRAIEHLSQGNKSNVEKHAVNCWHINDHESAAMWELYLKSSEGVAIQSTYHRFKSCFESQDPILIGKVNYIDYENDSIPEGNIFFPIMHKRKSFEHEQELRAVTSKWALSPHTEQVNATLEPIEFGIDIPVNIKTLIENIYIAPTAPLWFAELVRLILARYELNVPVKQSSINDKPLY